MADDSIFSGEEDIVRDAEALLEANSTQVPSGAYGRLLDRYKRLFVQLQRIMRMADRFQLELAVTSQRLEELSQIDVVTGIANRRSFNTAYQREWKKARRDGLSMAVSMIDIDHFKRFNDLYGHLPGDVCLERVAGAIDSCLKRPGDYVARFGGEEFAAILANTDTAGAQVVAEKILQAVASLAIPHIGSSYGVVTVSVGIAVDMPPRDDPFDLTLLRAADEALYEAKSQGRHCARVRLGPFSPRFPPPLQ
jgi:diguanylate cyclase (GGDEF)-like protein